MDRAVIREAPETRTLDKPNREMSPDLGAIGART